MSITAEQLEAMGWQRLPSSYYRGIDENPNANMPVNPQFAADAGWIRYKIGDYLRSRIDRDWPLYGIILPADIYVTDGGQWDWQTSRHRRTRTTQIEELIRTVLTTHSNWTAP